MNHTLMSGQFLKERLDNNYVTIGSTTTGNFTLYSEYDPSTGGKITSRAIPQNVNSFNYTLGKYHITCFYWITVTLKDQQRSGLKQKTITKYRAQLFPNESAYFDKSLLEQFDIIFHIRKTSPSHIK